MDYANLLRTYGGSQSVADAECLVQCCEAAPNSIYVEIGSKWGTSTFVIGSEARKRGGTLYCYEPNPRVAWVWNMIRADLCGHVVLLERESPPKPAMPFDRPGFVYIDGAHKYEPVLADYAFWWRTLAPGGIIAFHDWKPDCPKWGVTRAVRRITTEPFAERVTNGRGVIAFRK